MPSADTIIAFVCTSAVLAFIPGPDNLIVLTQSASRGWRVGVVITLGLCTGLIVHTAAVALGISVIFQQSELAFVVLKAVGAAYLLYLAYGAFRAGPAEVQCSTAAPSAYLRMYARGILMNLANPKVAIFFLAFFPQFISAERGTVPLQVAILGMLFIATSFVAFSIISLLAGTISHHLLTSNKAQSVLNWLAGLVFVGLAGKLALSDH